MSKKEKYLVVIAGPTAVGKTYTGIQLAKRYSTEIISADSRQFYREMIIGTAKPSDEELAEVKHHFINNLSIHQGFNIGDFERQALNVADEIFKTNKIAIVVGGSGLYIKTLTEGMDKLPQTKPETRQMLNGRLVEEGIDALLNDLKEQDPQYYELVDRKNPQRVIRALEVCIDTGMPFSSFRKNEPEERSFKVIKIGLTMDREELYGRINERMDLMIEAGLFEEVESLSTFRENNALQTVGYKEVFDFMDGQYDREEAVRLLKRNSRRYAKRQLTWFRKDSEYTWLHPKEIEKMVSHINERIGTK